MQRPFVISALMMCLAPSALAGPVEDMCLAGSSRTDAQCACATPELKGQLAEEDFTLYEVVAAAYLKNLDGGMDRGDAWEAAVRAHKRPAGFIATLEATNLAGGAHARAIKDCEDAS